MANNEAFKQIMHLKLQFFAMGGSGRFGDNWHFGGVVLSAGGTDKAGWGGRVKNQGVQQAGKGVTQGRHWCKGEWRSKAVHTSEQGASGNKQPRSKARRQYSSTVSSVGMSITVSSAPCWPNSCGAWGWKQQHAGRPGAADASRPFSPLPSPRCHSNLA